jgi:hypothetical protein
MPTEVKPRGFTPPLTVEDLGAAFRVKDRTGMAVAYVYYEDRPEWQSDASQLTEDEARRVAANIAKLPNLLKRHE